MPTRSTARPARRRVSRRPSSAFWPNAARRRRGWRAFRRAPVTARAVAALLALALLWTALNGIVQVIRKPTELFFPVSGTLYKTPAQTWNAYAPLFREHATSVITAEFLAALAQVEGSGNPVVRTYWRWSWRAHPFELYRPASSAVGMYQITDGTFERARRYCIHDHVVVEEGPWHDWHSCWFNDLYFRVVPSHAIELTSAFLDRAVADALRRHPVRAPTRAQVQRLAALVHLCGTGGADRYARRGLLLPSGMRCGSHDAAKYLAKVERMRSVFAELAAR